MVSLDNSRNFLILWLLLLFKTFSHIPLLTFVGGLGLQISFRTILPGNIVIRTCVDYE